MGVLFKNKNVHKFVELSFDTFILISYVLLIFTAFNVSTWAPEYLKIIDTTVKVFVCIFLLFRFNPWHTMLPHPFMTDNKFFTKLDRKIAFNAGLFILTTTALNWYLTTVTGRAKTVGQTILNDL